MAYMDESGKIIKQWEKIKEKNKRQEVIIGRKFHYVGYVIWEFKRIAFYEWLILDYNTSTWICKCEVLDRDITLNPDRNRVIMNIPFSILTLY